MKFVMTQAVCPEGLGLLKETELYIADDPEPKHYLRELQDADGLIVRLGNCSTDVINCCRNLKVIGRTGVGYDSVDVKRASELGIPVVITPGANSRSVAEHAVGMMFALSKNFVQAQWEMRQGNWEIRGAGRAFELAGKSVGVIGLGAIGRETAAICAGIGMRVLGYDPFLAKERAEQIGLVYYEDYENLIADADIVTIHVPLTEITRNMISYKQLTKMKRSALLINCSRGGIVNERDLITALEAGVIAGAGLDAFDQEPLLKDSPLLTCPNLVLSPHSAAQTKEAIIRMARGCVIGCLAVCRGEKWPFVADQSVYEHPRWGGKPWADTTLCLERLDTP